MLGDGGGEITLDPQKGPVVDRRRRHRSARATERVGKLGVVGFDNLAVLEKTGDNLYRSRQRRSAAPATDAQVRQGMLEGSNVNADRSR